MSRVNMLHPVFYLFMKKYSLPIGCLIAFISSCHPVTRENKVLAEMTSGDSAKPGNSVFMGSAKTDSLKAEIAEEIKTIILSGFYDKQETIDEIGDMFYKESLDETWINKTVEDEYRK